MRQTISWDQLFLSMCHTLASKSKDDSTQVGAVLVDSNHVVVSTGYNGPPPGINDEMVPWKSRPEKYAYIIHAEENALLFGMEAKGSVAGSTMYSSHHPCTECLLRLIRAKVKRVIIPKCHTPFPLSKYQVEPGTLLLAQPFPRLEIVEVEYVK